MLSNLLFFSSGCSSCVLAEEHQLLAVGTDDGRVECWDPRSPVRAGVLDVNVAVDQLTEE